MLESKLLIIGQLGGLLAKTRSGNDPRNVRAIVPKMFAVPSNEKCLVKAYKVYAENDPRK